MSPRRHPLIAGASSIACALVLLAIGGCGESTEAKAEKTLCKGKGEVTAGVESLATATKQTLSVSAVETDLAMISGGLEKIGSAQSDLTGSRKDQVRRATSSLSSDLEGLENELKSLSPTEIKQRLTTAVEKLVSGYKQALAPIKC